MAKVKTVRQAYGATLTIAGKDVPPGTVVSLPQDEADKIAALFGTVPEERSLPKLPEVAKPPAPVKTVDLDALKAELEAAQLGYDSAKDALAAPDAGDEQLAAFEAAEKRLNSAEAALEEADGE